MSPGHFISRLGVSCSCLAIVTVLGAAPVGADNGSLGLGIGIGILMNKALNGLGAQGKGQPQNRQSKDGGTRNRSAGSGGSGKSPTPKEQTEVTANYAAEEEARRRIEQNEVAERNRNVEKAIAGFIEVLERQHIRLRGETVNVRAGGTINQVTAGEVRSEVDKAYMQARLTDFDRFAGELWTRDRLTVQILREADRGIQPYFDGVGAKGPSMTDLKDVFGKAAAAVYARALELAEIVGVSHSFDRFIRTIYENSDRVPESLWTIGADGQYERLLSRAINTIDRNYFIPDGPVVASDPHGLERLFQFRFRARRALYECLSAHYANMGAGQTGTDIGGALPATLTIDNSLTGDGSSRGAVLASGPHIPPKAISATGGAQATSVTVEDSQVWRIVQGRVTGECNQSMRLVADDARDQGLEPVPARWDGGGDAQGSSLPGLAPQFQATSTTQLK